MPFLQPSSRRSSPSWRMRWKHGRFPQRLLPSESGESTRVLATETLVANNAIRACIRDRRYEQLVGLIEIGGREGMNTIDESLAELYLTRKISKEEAIANARDPESIEVLTRLPEKPAARRGLFVHGRPPRSLRS